MIAFHLGHIKPWWNHEHQQLQYVHEEFNNIQDIERWQQSGWTQSRFTGDLYDMRYAEPAWIAPFREHVCMQHFCWSVYRMRSGDVLPEHTDSYARFCRIHDVTDIGCISRYLVFLESWQSGHYFEIAGTPIVQWQAGDWVMWRGAIPHMAANLGASPRYTLQLTGLDADVSQSQ